MERENKTIETPKGKNKVVIKSWISGREKRALSRVFLEGIPMSSLGKSEVKVNSADLIEKAENLTIETLVISIDGSTDKIVDKVLDMNLEDYNFVISEINKVTKGSAFLG